MPISAVFVLGLLLTNLATLFMLGREQGKRKRLEDRLWGIAAGRGLNGTELGDTGPIVLPTKNRHIDSSRIEQVESQLDQLAQQMDRLVESQEFLSRVLADRVERIPDPRLRTPH